jgi:hypothetical protein
MTPQQEDKDSKRGCETAMLEDFKAEVQKMNEKKAVAKALNLPAQKLKQFMYQTDKILVNQILMLYPESTHLTIINNDRRDGENVPTITVRTLRARFTDVTYSQGKRVLNSVEWQIFQNVICVVNNGIVNVKIINSNFDTKKEMLY